MKTLSNYETPNNAAYAVNDPAGFDQSLANLSRRNLSYRYSLGNPADSHSARKAAPKPWRLLTEEAAAEMAEGHIPDLEQVCRDLYHTFLQDRMPYSALQFIPVLKKLPSIYPGDMERFLKNPRTRHILVQNALLKVVLIHWKPGQVSSIHGHAEGGCVFRVLRGSLEEKRYTPDQEQRLLAVSNFQSGAMAYIDDDMAYHTVGNPFDTSAVSLHVYTPGDK